MQNQQDHGHIDDRWLMGYRDGSDEVPERLPDDQEYLEGYRTGMRHAQNRISTLGKRIQPSIFQFEAD